MTDTATEEVEPASDEGSTLIIALHVLMYTTLGCGVIAVMVVVLLTPRP